MVMVMTPPHLEDTLTAAIASARGGDTLTARLLLRRFVKERPGSVQAWVWLAYVAESIEEKRAALRNAVSLQPYAPRLRDAFLGTLSPAHVKAAAAKGIFISYARNDELTAVELAHDLNEAGFNTWLDIQDIPDDGDWHSEIAAALRRCGLMLLITSPNVVDDTDSTAERMHFMRTGKIIVPVLHESCDLKALDVWHPAIDFRRDYALGLHRLLGLLQKEQPTLQPVNL